MKIFDAGHGIPQDMLHVEAGVSESLARDLPLEEGHDNCHARRCSSAVVEGSTDLLVRPTHVMNLV